MDKIGLKDKRRETVIGLLKGMEIKKSADGGFEKDDVYECIQDLCNLYEEHIDELEKNYESEISGLNKRYQKYDENNELYVSLIMEAKKSSNEIINQAKSEVDEILNNGKEQIALQEKQLEQFRLDSEKEKKSIIVEIKASKDAAEAEKAAMKVELEAEREKLEATKNKYRQQIAAMDDEFAEIKTNILRTSARLDALKSQAEDIVPEVEWNVKEAEETVQIPSADIEIEDVVEDVTAPSDLFAETFFKSEVLKESPNAVVSGEPEVDPGALKVDDYQTAAEAEPVEEEQQIEAVTEDDLFEKKMTVEDLFTDAEPSPMTEEIVEAAPTEVTAEGESTVEATSDGDIEALLDELSFDDLLEEAGTDSPADGMEGEIEEISLEELETLQDETKEQEAADPGDHDAPEEISFESLEAIFKDEK